MPPLSSLSSHISPGEREMIYQELDNLRREVDEAQHKLEMSEKKLICKCNLENDCEKCKIMTVLTQLRGSFRYSCVPNKHIVPNKSIGWQIAQI